MFLLALAFGQVRSQEPTGTIRIVQGGTGQDGDVRSRGNQLHAPHRGPDRLLSHAAAGTKVQLKADAADGSKFEGWAPVNSCPKPKNLTIVAGTTHNCQPVFSFTEPPELLLQTFLVGSGTVTSDPAGISCTRDEDNRNPDGAVRESLPQRADSDA